MLDQKKVVISAQAEIQYPGITCPVGFVAWIPRLFLLMGAEDDNGVGGMLKQKRSSFPRRRKSNILVSPVLSVLLHGSPAFAEDDSQEGGIVDQKKLVISAQAEIQYPGITCPVGSVAWIPRLFLLMGAKDDNGVVGNKREYPKENPPPNR